MLMSPMMPLFQDLEVQLTYLIQIQHKKLGKMRGQRKSSNQRNKTISFLKVKTVLHTPRKVIGFNYLKAYKIMKVQNLYFFLLMV